MRCGGRDWRTTTSRAGVAELARFLSDPRVRRLADGIIESQNREIAELEALIRHAQMLPPATRVTNRYIPGQECSREVAPARFGIGGFVARLSMTPALFAIVAERFNALAEPARLHILHSLRQGERTVGELVVATSLLQANVSKHLQLLHAQGFVTRRK